jgi:hypothetical protein
MTRYTTTSGIEIHLRDLTDGMALEGVDVKESNAKASDLIREAVERAYPQYAVSMFGNQTQFYAVEVAGYPNEVDPDEVKWIAEEALGDSDGSRWLVLDEENSKEDRTFDLVRVYARIDPNDAQAWIVEWEDASGAVQQDQWCANAEEAGKVIRAWVAERVAQGYCPHCGQPFNATPALDHEAAHE